MYVFEARSNTFDNRCLRFMPTSLLTMQNSLPVVDKTLPGPEFQQDWFAKRLFQYAW